MSKINITTPPPHPMDRMVFSPTMVRAHLRKGCEPEVFKYRVPVPDKKKMSRHIKAVAREMVNQTDSKRALLTKKGFD